MSIEYKPQKKQYKMFETLTIDNGVKYVLYGGGAGGGKTYGGVAWLLIQALKYNGSSWFIARKKRNDLKESTFITIKNISREWNIESRWKFNGQDNLIEFDNGSRISLMAVAFQPTDPNYDDLGSKEYTGGMLEEAQEIDEKAFNVLKTRINRNNIFKIKDKKGNFVKEEKVPAKILLTANPHKGYLKREFYDRWKKGEIPENTEERLRLQQPYRDREEAIPIYLQIEFIQALYTDNKYLADDYDENLETGDLAQTQRLKFGDWEYDDSEDSLVKQEHITDLFTNTIIDTGEKFLIVDVSRMGGDRIVANYWEGLKSVKRYYFQKQGTDITATRIREIEIEHKIPRSNVLIDEDGVGGGVIDQLKGSKGFLNGSSPLKTKKALRRQKQFALDVEGKQTFANFNNLKSQCAFKLAEMIEDHKIAVTGEGTEVGEIIEELAAILHQKDKATEGKLKIIPKDSKNQNEKSVKKILGRSPDIADTFMMRMWFELIRDLTNATFMERRQPVHINNQRANKFAKGE